MWVLGKYLLECIDLVVETVFYSVRFAIWYETKLFFKKYFIGQPTFCFYIERFLSNKNYVSSS